MICCSAFEFRFVIDVCILFLGYHSTVVSFDEAQLSLEMLATSGRHITELVLDQS